MDNCLCGCGQRVRHVFAAGHDARMIMSMVRELYGDGSEGFDASGVTLGELMVRAHPRAAERVQARHAEYRAA